MNKFKLEEIIKRGEDSRTQFKEIFTSIDALAAEITAFLNSEGGKILVGVNDNGHIKGLSQDEVKQLNQWISNCCSNKIEPPVTRIYTENIKIDDNIVVLIDVPQGGNKFYIANNSYIWVKVGADKRRASREEMKRLLQESGNIYADEMVVENTSLDDIDLRLFKRFFKQRTKQEFNQEKHDLKKVLTNLKLMKNGQLTMAGVVLFAEIPEEILPSFIIKAVQFKGDDPAGKEYLQSQNFYGNLVELYKQGKNLLYSSLKREQKGQNFNSVGILEIPEIALEEALINALLHRDYYLASNIRLFIFNNRVEIISPGTLPNTATVEGIKLGLHVERNPVLVSIVSDMEGIPYRGIGTGILRILSECEQAGVEVDFVENKEKEEFKVIFYRS